MHTASTLGALPEDNEGLIDHLRGIDTVLIAAFFEEMEGGLVRISLRSKTPLLDVSAICGRYGGGGHKLAAGARMRGELAEVEARVLAHCTRRSSRTGFPLPGPERATVPMRDAVRCGLRERFCVEIVRPLVSRRQKKPSTLPQATASRIPSSNRFRKV